MKNQLAMLVTACLALSACGDTRLKSMPEGGFNKPTQGIPYRLPITQIEVAASWSLTDCATIDYKYDPDQNPADPNSIVVKEAVLKSASGSKPETFLRMKAGETIPVAVAKRTDGDSWPTVGQVKLFVPDLTIEPNVTHSAKTIEGETLIIDYQKLTRAFKTGSITVEYHKDTQILKSVNASVEGQEAAALKASVGFLSKVAGIAVGIGTGAPAPSGSGPQGAVLSGEEKVEQCTPLGKRLVKERFEAVSTIKADETKLKTINANVAKIQAAIAENAADEDVVEAEKRKLKIEKVKVAAVSASIKAQKAVLSDLNKSLTVSAKVTMPGANNSYPTMMKPSESALKKIFLPLLEQDERSLRLSDISDKAKLELSLAPVSLATENCLGSTEATEEDGSKKTIYFKDLDGCKLKTGSKAFQDGLVYRSPVPSVLKITSAATNKAILKKNLNVIQFGRLRELPLVNGFAESNALEVAFDAQGVPSKIAFKKTKSGALETLNALDGAAQTIAKLQADIKAKEDADLAAAKAQEAADLAAAQALAAQEVTDLQRARDLLTTQAEIDAILNPPVADTPEPTELETLQAEFDLLELIFKIRSIERQIEALEEEE